MTYRRHTVFGFAQDIEAYKVALESDLARSGRGFGFLPPAGEPCASIGDVRMVLFSAIIPDDYIPPAPPGFSVPVTDDIASALEGGLSSARTFALEKVLDVPARPTRERPADIASAKIALAAYARDAIAGIRAQMVGAREIGPLAAKDIAT